MDDETSFRGTTKAKASQAGRAGCALTMSSFGQRITAASSSSIPAVNPDAALSGVAVCRIGGWLPQAAALQHTVMHGVDSSLALAEAQF